MNSLILYGFTAGAVATVNPCGFALLPVWFAREMAANAERPFAVRLVRSATAAALVSLGFVAVFLVAGLLLASGAAWLGPALPWIGLALGLGLAAVGAAWLTGLRRPGDGAAGVCRPATPRYGAFGFGLSYGLVSISCTLPVFAAVAGMSVLGGGAVAPEGIVAFLAGAVAVLMLVAAAGAAAGAAMSAFARDRSRLLRPIAGALTLLAGLYIALYWGRLLLDSAPLADRIAIAIQAQASRVAAFLSSRAGIAALLVAGPALAGLAGMLAVRLRQARRRGDAHAAE